MSRGETFSLRDPSNPPTPPPPSNHQQVSGAAAREQRWPRNGGRRGGKHAPHTCSGTETSITHTVALATVRTLGPGQTPVSLLSLLARWSDKADQTGVTLRSDKEKRKKFLKKRKKKRQISFRRRCDVRRMNLNWALGEWGGGGSRLCSSQRLFEVIMRMSGRQIRSRWRVICAARISRTVIFHQQIWRRRRRKKGNDCVD